MSLDRLQHVQTWLIRLLLIIMVLLTGVASFHVYQGNLTRRMVSRRLGQLLVLPGLHRYQVAIVVGAPRFRFRSSLRRWADGGHGQ